MDPIELFHERAAIMEYDGGLPRAEAEKRAYFELKRLLNGQPMPKEVLEVIKNVVEKVASKPS